MSRALASARARAASARIQWRSVPGARTHRRTTKYHFPESAHLHAAGSRGSLEEERARNVPTAYSRELGVFLRREKTAAGARADAPASLFALARIVKYKRLANCVFRFHAESAFGFVRNEYLIVSRCLTAEIFCTFNRMRQWIFLC